MVFTQIQGSGAMMKGLQMCLTSAAQRSIMYLLEMSIPRMRGRKTESARAPGHSCFKGGS